MMTTGTPRGTVPTCHPERSHDSHGLCGSCARRRYHEQNPAVRAAFLERKRELARQTYASKPPDPAKRREERLRYKGRYYERERRYRQSRPETVSDWKLNTRLKNTYGITRAEYDAILARQNWACGICEDQLTWENRAVDHCHKTGVVRGVLCKSCNSGIGLLKDTYAVVQRAAAYLAPFAVVA